MNKLPTKPIETAYINSPGDPSVGLQGGAATLTHLGFDLSCFAEEDRLSELERVRTSLSELFQTIWGEHSAVVFDFEVPDEMPYDDELEEPTPPERVVCHCNDGFSDPDPECADCGGSGYVEGDPAPTTVEPGRGGHLYEPPLHTALDDNLPLKVTGQTHMEDDHHVVIEGAKGLEVAAVWVGEDKYEEVKATAEAIVRACNSQKALVNALKAMYRCSAIWTTDQETGETFDTIIAAALKLAKEEVENMSPKLPKDVTTLGDLLVALRTCNLPYSTPISCCGASGISVHVTQIDPDGKGPQPCVTLDEHGRRYLAVLSEQENDAWEDAFHYAKRTGVSDKAADEIAWACLQGRFPRLKAFEGCEP